MNENKKTNLKQLFLAFGGAICVAVIVICFLIAMNNTKTSTTNIANTNTSSITSSTYTTDSNTSRASSNTENENSSETNISITNYETSTNLTDSKNISITNGGSYNLSGSYESITINTTKDVVLNLNEVEITNENGPAINVIEAEDVSIVLTGNNKMTATTTEDLDGAIYSKADLVFSGTGSIEIKSNYDGIVSKDTLVINEGTYSINSSDDGIRGKDNVIITNGTFNITAGGDGIKSTNDEDTSKGYITISGGTFNIKSDDDGIQAETNITIKNGTFDIIAKEDGIHANGLIEINDGTLIITAAEGIEATYVKINEGTISITASDDGINAGKKSNNYTPTIEINGGYITIMMASGDTDGIDSNGNLYINGGTVDIKANSPFDYDGTAQYNGGTIIVNGTQTNTITNQMMGGGDHRRRTIRRNEF